MSDFVTLTCPSCGGKLQITRDIDRFACAHCGREHVVRRGGGLVSLSPVIEQIKHVGAVADRTASELAIHRLTSEIAELEGTRSCISTDRSQVRKESSPHAPMTRFDMLALVLAVAVLIIGCVAFPLLAEKWEYAILAPIVGLVTAYALVAILMFRIYFRGAAWINQEIARRQAEITRLEREIASKKEELQKHQKTVSA